MVRGRRVFMAALAVSLLAHLALMGEVGLRGLLPLAEPGPPPPPIEARLQALPVEAPPTPAGVRVPSPRTALTSAPVPAAPPAEPPGQPQSPPSSLPDGPPVGAAPSGQALPLPEAGPDPGPQASAAPAGPPEPPLPAQAESSPVPPSPARVRALPASLTLVYDIRIGDEGFNVGRGTYTWRAEGDRYQLESVAEATGLAALFVGGQATQASEGRVGPGGLEPALFRMSRNDRRQEVARFDWQARRLDLSRGEVPLRPQTQDLLSFPFHLAMTVDAGSPDWILPVTNGRKLKGYRFSVLGRETLELGGQAVDTLHVQGRRALEGTLDVWLAPGRHWLPLRIRTQDQQGKIMLLSLAP